MFCLICLLILLESGDVVAGISTAWVQIMPLRVSEWCCAQLILQRTPKCIPECTRHTKGESEEPQIIEFSIDWKRF